MAEPPKPPEKPDKPSPWTPEMVKTILDGVTPLADRFINLKEKEFDHNVKMEKATSKAAWWILFILMVFLGSIIGLVSWLVVLGKVSGDALLFLIGTVAGYVLAMVQRHLFPEIVEVPEE